MHLAGVSECTSEKREMNGTNGSFVVLPVIFRYYREVSQEQDAPPCIWVVGRLRVCRMCDRMLVEFDLSGEIAKERRSEPKIYPH